MTVTLLPVIDRGRNGLATVAGMVKAIYKALSAMSLPGVRANDRSRTD